MHYCIARGKKEEARTAYRVYLTDALQCAAENTARLAGGRYPQARYADLAGRRKRDERSGAEIAAEVIKKAGLVVV